MSIKTTNQPTPPKALKGRGRELWQHYAAEMTTRNVFQECDAAALEMLCRLEAQGELLTRQIETEGAVKEDRDGTLRRHPALMALQSIAAMVGDIKKQLSIGVVIRHKVGDQSANEPDLSNSIVRFMKKDTGT